MNNLINLFLCGILLLLVFLSFTNPNKVNIKANNWFGAFLLCIFILSTDSVYSTLGINIKSEVIQSFLSIAGNFLAPFFYISISYFIKPNRKWRKTDYFHFLFGILFFIFIYSALTVFQDTKNFENSIGLLANIFTFLSYIFSTLFVIQLVLYGILSYKKLEKHNQNIQLYASNTTNIDLKWLQNIVIAVNVLILIWIPDMLLNLSSENFSPINFFLLIGMFLLPIIS